MRRGTVLRRKGLRFVFRFQPARPATVHDTRGYCRGMTHGRARTGHVPDPQGSLVSGAGIGRRFFRAPSCTQIH